MTFPEGLLRAFNTAQSSIFRLETLQHYDGDPNFDRFVDGGQWVDTESKRQWCELVRRRTSEGVRMQRVHLVELPLTDYMRFEMAWSYPPNAEAGEDVRIALAPVPGLQQGRDFWLFDDRDLWAMYYTVDGVFMFAEQINQQRGLSQARDWRDLALARSEPLQATAQLQ